MILILIARHMVIEIFGKTSSEYTYSKSSVVSHFVIKLQKSSYQITKNEVKAQGGNDLVIK